MTLWGWTMATGKNEQIFHLVLSGACAAGSLLIVYRALDLWRAKILKKHEQSGSNDEERSHEKEESASNHQGGPKASPLSSPVEIWNYDTTCDSRIARFYRSHTIKPQQLRPLPMDRPRLLVCHDMAGGYLNDKYIQGGRYDTAYRVFDWSIVDIFVYFGHTLLTIPPAGWVDVGHLNGVKVLGTFITEWDEGAETCKAIFASEVTAEKTAWQMANIAQDFGFDGWLINIENPILQSHIEFVKLFLQKLTQFSHQFNKHAQVIWYDSVTINGELKWQDRLNELNRPFFDLCDGLFTNYTWKEGYPAEGAAAAGARRRWDVYFGIDVFGRNTYGGGGMQCNKALEKIAEAGVSAALFAPGWVMQNQMENGGSFTGNDPKEWDRTEEEFVKLSTEFWDKIKSFFEQRGPWISGSAFCTFFSQGVGKHFSIAGEAHQHDTFWYNVSLQSPDCRPKIERSNGSLKLLGDYEESYEGGSCLQITGELHAGEEEPVNFDCSKIKVSASCTFEISLAYKLSQHSRASLALVFLDESGRGGGGQWRAGPIPLLAGADAAAHRVLGNGAVVSVERRRGGGGRAGAGAGAGGAGSGGWSLIKLEVKVQSDCRLSSIGISCYQLQGRMFSMKMGKLAFGDQLCNTAAKTQRITVEDFRYADGGGHLRSEASSCFTISWPLMDHIKFTDIFLLEKDCDSDSQVARGEENSLSIRFLGRCLSGRFQVLCSDIEGAFFCLQQVDVMGNRQPPEFVVIRRWYSAAHLPAAMAAVAAALDGGGGGPLPAAPLAAAAGSLDPARTHYVVVGGGSGSNTPAEVVL